jgi:hypothetical protein
MNNSFHQQIHLYMEGLLPEYAEAILFAELSHNSDLRAEMTRLLKLQSAVKSHAASISIAPSAKDALFAELGLQMPNQLSAQQVGAGFIARNPRFFAASLSICSSLVTALVMLLFFRSGLEMNTDTDISDKNIFRKGSPNNAFQPNNQTLPIRDTIHETATIIRYLPARQTAMLINTDVEEEQQQHPSTTSNPELSAESFQFTSKQPLYINTDETFEAIAAPTANIPAHIPVQPVQETRSHIATQALPSTNTDAKETLPVRLSLRHALGVGQAGIHGGINYALTKQHTIGFEGGTEGARLLLRNARSAEVRPVSEGDDVVFSGTAFYRYTFAGAAFRSFAPFLQGGIGVIDKCGAVQGMVGIRFDVMPELSFTLAAEGKMPVFFAERHFQSKTALSIGMQYHISEK